MGPMWPARALPYMLFALAAMFVAYRYYSAFIAAKIFALDPATPTPAHRLNDGQNYHPTKKWVLFGHHFAAIAGAGPLIGPVLAAQFGFLPGLLWIVVGVCLAGAVVWGGMNLEHGASGPKRQIARIMVLPDTPPPPPPPEQKRPPKEEQPKQQVEAPKPQVQPEPEQLKMAGAAGDRWRRLPAPSWVRGPTPWFPRRSFSSW